jgi:hypothetical protein
MLLVAAWTLLVLSLFMGMENYVVAPLMGRPPLPMPPFATTVLQTLAALTSIPAFCTLYTLLRSHAIVALCRGSIIRYEMGSCQLAISNAVLPGIALVAYAAYGSCYDDLNLARVLDGWEGLETAEWMPLVLSFAVYVCWPLCVWLATVWATLGNAWMQYENTLEFGTWLSMIVVWSRLVEGGVRWANCVLPFERMLWTTGVVVWGLFIAAQLGILAILYNVTSLALSHKERFVIPQTRTVWDDGTWIVTSLAIILMQTAAFSALLYQPQRYLDVTLGITKTFVALAFRILLLQPCLSYAAYYPRHFLFEWQEGVSFEKVSRNQRMEKFFLLVQCIYKTQPWIGPRRISYWSPCRVSTPDKTPEDVAATPVESDNPPSEPRRSQRRRGRSIHQ